MKAIRIHGAKGEPLAFVLPANWLERVALWCRGYRPANLHYTAIQWWRKKREVGV